MEFFQNIPVSVWVGTAAALIILLGWYFNVWQVIGVKNSFPYLEISKPLPELHHIEPQSTLPGETITLHGAKLEAFDPRSSRVVIGSLPGEVHNWQRKAARIMVKVPKGLKPGRYPVSVQIGKRQSAEEVLLDVRLLSQELAQQMENGERILVLVAQFEDSQGDSSLQTDLVEQMRYYVSQDEQAKDKLLIEAWPETVTGDMSVQLAEITRLTHARLILFGRSGSGENFYPRIFSNPPAEDVLHSTEQQLKPASLTQMQVGSPYAYEMAAQPIREPLRMARFLLGLSRYDMGDNHGAQSILSDLLDEKNLEAVDKASLRLALGRVTMLIGTDILKKPLRSNEDHREGDALLKEGMDHLKRAALELERFPDRRYHTAQVYISMGKATQQLPFRSQREKRRQSIDYFEKALQHLDCEHEFTDCMITYDNQGSNYEWLASVQWDRGVNDDLLEKSIALSDNALLMHAARVRENEELPNELRVDKELLESEGTYFRNQRGIAKGHLYRGNRNQNLREAVALSKEALPIFLARGEEMNGRIALTYNHIGISLVNQEGDRAALLQQASETFEQGLAYVGPKYFPEFYQLLSDNKKLVERLIAQGNKMLEGETAARYESEFDRLFRAGQFPESENQATAYLNWSWREFKEPHRYTATAHALLARVAQQAGGVTLALWHTVSAHTILSRYETWDDRQLQQAKDLDKKIIELAQANGYDVTAVQTLLHNAKNGFRLYKKNKAEGDRLLTINPIDAIKSYDTALSFYPHDPLVLVNRSNAKLRATDLDGYALDLSDALLIYPDDPIARYNRGQLYLNARRWQDALEDSVAAIRAGGEEAGFYVLRAATYEGMGEKEKALADYRVALQRAEREELRTDIEVRIAKLEQEAVD